jgi:gluconokinase
MLPFLVGERAPIWSDSVTGVIAGLRLSTGKPELLRAGMEAVAYRFRLMYDGLREVAIAPHRIIANGGAVLRSPAWLQILADVLEHELLALPPEEESSARGAAMLALEAAGLAPSLEALPDPISGARAIAPNPAAAAPYAAARARQARLEERLCVNGKWWEE